MWFVAWPSAAQAHGFPDKFIAFVLTFYVLAFALSTIADAYAIKRWLIPGRALAAAAQANIVTALAAVPVILLLDWLGRTILQNLEPVHVDYVRVFNMYSVPATLFITWLGNLLIKCLFLKWRFDLAVSGRTIGILFLANLLSTAIAGLFALNFI
jgi:hypothetical protein